MKLFGKNKKQFDYQSDAQLVAALIAGQQAAFDYVFDRYHELLHSTIKSAFHIKEEKKVKQMFKERCAELQNYLLADNCAKLKLYNPDGFGFVEWLASVSQTFFKKVFCDDNIALVERYRKGDRAIFVERFQNSCEQIIRRMGVEEGDGGGFTILLLEDIHKHLLKDNCENLNKYNPSRQTFDVWFKVVIHNFLIDRLKDDNEYKLRKEVIDSGGFVRIDDEDISPGWDSKILILDDKDKIELIQKMRKTLKTLEPPRYRDILIDRFYKGKKYEEIAESYQMTKANAYNLVSRALDRMKTKIEEGYGLKTKR